MQIKLGETSQLLWRHRLTSSHGYRAAENFTQTVLHPIQLDVQGIVDQINNDVSVCCCWTAATGRPHQLHIKDITISTNHLVCIGPS